MAFFLLFCLGSSLIVIFTYCILGFVSLFHNSRMPYMFLWEKQSYSTHTYCIK